MKIIHLTNGNPVMIDDSDFDYINQFKWRVLHGKHTLYAITNGYVNGKRTALLMHRIILDIPKGMEGDHIDGNGLNNQRGNLRLATISQNRGNHLRKRASATSKFKGVSWSKSARKWVANIQVDKKYFHLGSFRDEKEAAEAYDAAAIEHFKEFASPNF